MSSVFIYISADWCGHCKSFSANYWGKTKDMIKQKFPSMRTEEIVLGKGHNFSEYPENFFKIFIGYPSFAIVPSKMWDNSINSKEKPSVNEGVFLFNALKNGSSFEHSKPDHIPQGLVLYNRDPNGFEKWITSVINSNEYKDLEKGDVKIKKIAKAPEALAFGIPEPVKPLDVCKVKIISRKK